LKGLAVEQARRIRDVVERFATTGHGDVKALQGDGPGYRLRVGDYRVLFDQAGNVVSVVRVAHRRESYR
jgi:mRNA interferase RelE/StbE